MKLVNGGEKVFLFSINDFSRINCNIFAMNFFNESDIFVCLLFIDEFEGRYRFCRKQDFCIFHGTTKGAITIGHKKKLLLLLNNCSKCKLLNETKGGGEISWGA